MKRLPRKQPPAQPYQDQQRLLALHEAKIATLPHAAREKCVTLWAELLRAVVRSEELEEGGTHE